VPLRDPRTDVGDIYAQHVNAAGAIVAGWPVNGLAVCTAANVQFDVRLAPDGSGGVYVSWSDQRNGSTYHVYTTRVNANGTFATGWPVNGATSTGNAVKNELKPQVAADGLGGLYVVWQVAFALGDDDQYIVRWNGNGTVGAGFPSAVNAAVGEQLSPSLAVDPASHAATIAYQDNNTGGGDFDIHLKGYSTAGAVLFDRTQTSTADQSDAQLVADGFGGAYLAYTEFGVSPSGVSIGRVNASGSTIVGPIVTATWRTRRSWAVRAPGSASSVSTS
jgi:hypothetical protein